MKTASMLLALAVLCSPRAARAEDFVIGVEHALTGPIAFVGVPSNNAIQLAADEINASGVLGANRIRLEIADGASDKAQAMTLLSRFAADPAVLMVIGPTSSVDALAAAPLANDLRIAMFTTALSSEVLKAGPWVFKGTIAPTVFMHDIAAYAVDKLHVARCSLVFDRQNEATVASKNLFRATVADHGVEIVSEDGVLGSDSDFSAIVTKAIDANPDCLMISTQAPVSANLIVQMRQGGLPAGVHVIGTTTESSQQYIDIAGAAANGVVFGADFVPGGRDDAGRTFVADYQKRFGAKADNYAAISYTMMQLAARAIMAAGPHPTRQAVRDALAATKDVPVIIGQGRFSLGPDRSVQYGAALLTIRDGHYLALE